MFAGCSYKTNIYGAFKGAFYKWRKHTPHTINDLKPGIVGGPVDSPAVVESFERSTTEQLDEDLPSEELPDEESTDLTKVIEQKKR